MIPFTGGCTFAEDPCKSALDARIIWAAAIDPGALSAIAWPSIVGDPNALDPNRIKRWLSVAVDANGIEHAVFTDGHQHLRLDVEEGSLLSDDPVVLCFRIEGLVDVDVKLASLRRFLRLVRDGRFARPKGAPEPKLARQILVLRVHDALATGASQLEIARVLFGDHQRGDFGADALRSRVRRLVREARRMHRGAWRSLMCQPRR